MTVPDRQRRLYDLSDAGHDRSEDYYDDSLTLLCPLVMTGNVWDPTVTRARPLATQALPYPGIERVA
jgi:hypothetical protein